MNLSLRKLSKYGFNRRTLTEQDFYDICEREGIEVIEKYQTTSFYMVLDGKPIIVISKRKRGLKRLFTMFHELAHHFLHTGKSLTEAFYYGMIENKKEMEADAFATIALIPRNKMYDFDFLEDYPNKFARQVFKNRQKLDFLYKI